jgi:hypothetical protein
MGPIPQPAKDVKYTITEQKSGSTGLMGQAELSDTPEYNHGLTLEQMHRLMFEDGPFRNPLSYTIRCNKRNKK